ncbi:MAG TPA: flagellar biosynthetic protein FliR [Syntrophomonadaceae bacterium]|nr:flagellar biosynthetic protein FliR [Syntrophomonadaceae bacterium]
MPFALEPFLLIFARLSGLFISAPIFSSKQIPVRIKIFVLVVLAGSLAFFVPARLPMEVGTPMMFVWAMVLEILVGYTIGFVANLILAGLQTAGQLMDMQLGFGIVNVVDPQSGTQIPLMGSFTQALALLCYLGINGHYFLLQGLVDSYRLVPVLGFNMNGSFMSELVRLTANMFIIAIKVSAPIVTSVLTADISMGFIARTVPQMNVFVVGMPVKILLGLVSLLIMLPIYLWVFQVLFEGLFSSLDNTMRLMGM